VFLAREIRPWIQVACVNPTVWVRDRPGVDITVLDQLLVDVSYAQAVNVISRCHRTTSALALGRHLTFPPDMAKA
jgi:hypothetical protein